MNKEIIELTKEHWKEFYGRDLSDLEAEQIIRNVAQFFDLLDRWDKEEKVEKECLKEISPTQRGKASQTLKV